MTFKRKLLLGLLGAMAVGPGLAIAAGTSITVTTVNGASCATDAGPASSCTTTYSVPAGHSLTISSPSAPPPPSGTAHYLYTVTEGSIDVFDIDNGFAQVGTISLPQTARHGIRGVTANPAGHVLYVSYGGDGGSQGNGSLLAYDLVTNQVLWSQNFSHGIDSMAITPDGKTIYMPDGESSADGLWYVLDATTGNQTGTIDTGVGTGDNGPHNTVVSLDGKSVYMGDRNLASSGSNYFYAASTATNQVTLKVGPFQSGIRPFAVNNSNTLVYTSVTGLSGFQVGDLTTGKVLYTAPISRPTGTACPNSGASDPSHGVSLSPSEQQLYVLDWPCNGVAVFDVSKVPTSAPTQIAWIPVHAFNPNQSPCTYDCLGDGWLLHSSDGRYVFVGDSGDVIDTTTQKVVANVSQLYQTRVYLEIDWSGGAPSFTTTRYGLGRSSTPPPPPPPTPSPPPPPPPITFVQGRSTAVSGSPLSLSYSSNVSAGDFLVGVFRTPSGSTPSVSDNLNGAWTKAPLSDAWISIFYVPSAKAGTTTVTLTDGGASGTERASIAEYAGVVAAGPFDSGACRGNSSNPASTGSTAAIGAGELVFAGIGSASAGLTVAAGSSNGVSATARGQTSNSNGTIAAEDVLSSAAGAQNATFTLNGQVSDYGNACVATFK